MSMSRSARLIRLLLAVIVSAAASSARAAEPAPRLPTEPIHAQLVSEPNLVPAKWGKRQVTLMRMPTTPYRLRLRLGGLLGELVETYEFNMARVTGIILGGEPPYAHRIEIRAIPSPRPGHVSEVVNGALYVSQDVLDLLVYGDFSFSLHTHGLRALPLEYYGGKPFPGTISVGDNVHIHRRNPGVLAAPGQWGWDVPGSPDWKNAFSYVDIPLAEGEYSLPISRAMKAPEAREGFRRMLFRHHVLKDKLFVNDHFRMQNLTVDLSRVMNAIYRHNPEAYRILTAVQSRKKEQDDQAYALLAGLERSFSQARDASGVLRLSNDAGQRLALVGSAMAAFKDDVSEAVWTRWLALKQEADDAPWQAMMAERQLTTLPALANGGDPGQAARERSAEFARSARNSGTVSAALRRKIEEVDRVIQLSAPIEILSPADGSSSEERVITLRGRAPSEANKSLKVTFNQAEQAVAVNGAGEFSTSVVLKRGTNEIAVCRESVCKNVRVTGTMPELALMATLTWDPSTDLDLYMQAPDGRRCHYGSKTVGGLCSLDIDDQKGFRPENISVPVTAPEGTYRFWVQNYSGQARHSGTLKVYLRGVLTETRDFTTSSSRNGDEASITIRWSP